MRTKMSRIVSNGFAATWVKIAITGVALLLMAYPLRAQSAASPLSGAPTTASDADEEKSYHLLKVNHVYVGGISNLFADSGHIYTEDFIKDDTSSFGGGFGGGFGGMGMMGGFGGGMGGFGGGNNWGGGGLGGFGGGLGGFGGGLGGFGGGGFGGFGGGGFGNGFGGGNTFGGGRGFGF